MTWFNLDPKWLYLKKQCLSDRPQDTHDLNICHIKNNSEIFSQEILDGFLKVSCQLLRALKLIRCFK